MSNDDNKDGQNKPCQPCMLYQKQLDRMRGRPNLRLFSAESQHVKFINEYRLLPQSQEELVAMFGGKWQKKVLLTKPINQGKLRSFMFNYVGVAGGKPVPQENIFTDIFKGAGVAKIFLPGEYTPTCDGTHMPSYLQPDTLRSLKEAGIDVIVFVTPGKQDSLCRWLRDALQQKGLGHLMPDSLPAADPDARLDLDAQMPLILGQANPGLEDINAHGLIIGKNRLGITSHRAYAIYDSDGDLRLLVKAPDPSLEQCAPTLSSSMLKEVQKLELKPRVLPRASL